MNIKIKGAVINNRYGIFLSSDLLTKFLTGCIKRSKLYF
jgi:hypothetical protein